MLPYGMWARSKDPSVSLTLTFYSPPSSRCLALASHSFRLVGVRAAGRDRICVTSCRCTQRGCSHGGVRPPEESRAEARIGRVIRQDSRNAMCHHFLTIGRVGGRGGEERRGGREGKGNSDVCVRVYTRTHVGTYTYATSSETRDGGRRKESLHRDERYRQQRRENSRRGASDTRRACSCLAIDSGPSVDLADDDSL